LAKIGGGGGRGGTGVEVSGAVDEKEGGAEGTEENEDNDKIFNFKF
jgi:hypothetical protein